MAKGIKYEAILGKGRDMASDEYPPDEDITTSTDKPMRGGNRVVGPAASRAGAGRGMINPTAAKPQRSPMVEEAIQEMQDEKARKKISSMGYKSGGSVSASKRADGIAKQGKTKGRVI